MASAGRWQKIVRWTRGVLEAGGKRWIDAEAYRLSASLCYYALFSVFPLILVAISVGEIALGDSVDLKRSAIRALDGSNSQAVRTVLEETITSAQGTGERTRWGLIIGIAVAAFGASGIFLELDAAFEKLFRVRTPDRTLLQNLRLLALERASALLLVMVTTVLLLVGTLVLSAVNVIVENLPGVASLPLFATAAPRIAADVTSVVVLGVALGLCYRTVPNLPVRWRAAWVGGFAASALLYLVRWPFTWAASHLTSYAAYGVVGALLLMLTWLYVAGCVLLFGGAIAAVENERTRPLESARREQRARTAAAH